MKEVVSNINLKNKLIKIMSLVYELTRSNGEFYTRQIYKKDRFVCEYSYLTSVVKELKLKGFFENINTNTKGRIKMIKLTSKGEKLASLCHEVNNLL